MEGLKKTKRRGSIKFNLLVIIIPIVAIMMIGLVLISYQKLRNYYRHPLEARKAILRHG